jgi:transposase
MYGVAGKKFQRQYKKKISDFMTWDNRSHADSWLIFPENISDELSIDEVALSGGELYTVVTSKKAKGRKGCMVAIIHGTDSDTVITHLQKIDGRLRLRVKEITLDMAGSMKLIARRCFPKATQVIDRFHVQQLAGEALQEIRIKHRWDAIDQENEMISLAKAEKQSYSPDIHANGDTTKQLLARSRHLLYKSPHRWTENQKQRAEILFELYPDIKKAYHLTNDLRKIYNQKTDKPVAMTKLARWFNDLEASGFKSFNTLLRTIMVHYNDILNYFNHRNTNASAESFNAKIKAFRTQFRGVRDRAFFLFRIANIFA